MIVNSSSRWCSEFLQVGVCDEADNYLTINIVNWIDTEPPRKIMVANPKYADVYVFRRLIKNPYKLGPKTILKYEKVPQKELDNVFRSWINEVTNNTGTVQE